MAVKLRLMRMGKTKQPVYRVVVMDSRRPRDSRYIEQIGRYDPRPDPSLVEIDNERALDWLRKGAQPTDSVRKLLAISGAMSRRDVAAGQVHTVDKRTPAGKAAAPPAPPPPAAPAAAPNEVVAVTEGTVEVTEDAPGVAEGAAAIEEDAAAIEEEVAGVAEEATALETEGEDAQG